MRGTVGAHRADPARSITLVTQLVKSHACPKSHSKIDYDSAFKRRMDVDLQFGNQSLQRSSMRRHMSVRLAMW